MILNNSNTNKMGNCYSGDIPYYQHPVPERFTTYLGAGMIFDNGHTILCGYEPYKSNKKQPALYGIGGKRESTDFNYRETAAREVLEELFGLVAPSRATIQRILVILPRQEVIVGGYVMLRYGFDDLVQMLRTLRKQASPYYHVMPQSVSDLILKRGRVAGIDPSYIMRDAELSHLCLLPMVLPALRVSKDLATDIARLLSEKM
jgi:hypothetical protein